MKNKLKDLVTKFRKVGETKIDAIERMRKTAEAAKKEGRQVQSEKG